MIVQAIWEFDVDVDDLDPKFVDIEAFAKSMAMVEMDFLLRGDPSLEHPEPEITYGDFEYIVKENKNDHFRSCAYYS